jgi:predicted methyltransferase
MRRLPRLAIFLAISLAVAACSKSHEEAKAPEAPPPEPAAAATPAPTADAAAIDASIASTDRSAEDKEQDSWRRPAEVLTFLELRPGLHTLDYFAASGYYTELMSRTVGADGKVIAYNNPE